MFLFLKACHEPRYAWGLAMHGWEAISMGLPGRVCLKLNCFLWM